MIKCIYQTTNGRCSASWLHLLHSHVFVGRETRNHVTNATLSIITLSTPSLNLTESYFPTFSKTQKNNICLIEVDRSVGYCGCVDLDHGLFSCNIIGQCDTPHSHPEHTWHCQQSHCCLLYSLVNPHHCPLDRFYTNIVQNISSTGVIQYSLHTCMCLYSHGSHAGQL